MGWEPNNKPYSPIMHLIQRPSAHQAHTFHTVVAREPNPWRWRPCRGARRWDATTVTVSGRRGSSQIHEARDGDAPRESRPCLRPAAMPVRRRQPRRQETGAAERYRGMGIAAALLRPWDYPTACGELAALLRIGYAEIPKAAQALVASDVLLALRLLPDVQTGYALSAANTLLQAVEVALPKQKKAQAVSEFKHSVIAHKRRARVQQNSGLPHIPHDVLVHIFTFLDMHSLVATGLVCWSWNSAANDNNLWKMHYSLFFGLCRLRCNSIPVSGVQKSRDLVQSSIDSVSIDPNFWWKESFHSKYAECASWKFASNRALCGQCRSVIWLSNLTCAAPHHCPRNGRDEVKLRPLLPDTVAKYILHHDDLAASSSSESDDTDDSDYENGHPRFWTF
ncbi:hypothetical protein PAHAL_3G206100 [Panicum hallii]|uniref:F-box domain-containing protein n=2 Tax=Panicum hallii TaxID=206008 RepID=A0A2T8KIU4_9POAL|nr:hypothetical protein PAHAL_3G206100 [Panicum hallii]